jgi:hypothetical protein
MTFISCYMVKGFDRTASADDADRIHRSISILDPAAKLLRKDNNCLVSLRARVPFIWSATQVQPFCISLIASKSRRASSYFTSGIIFPSKNLASGGHRL